MYATSTGIGGIIKIQTVKNFKPTNTPFELVYTGTLGDDMKESIKCSFTTAINYLNNNLKKYKIDDINKKLSDEFPHGIHVHVPSIGSPKDGPSAGSAFTLVFISLITNIKIKNTVSMTGEIELSGKITKIGGLNYKLIGAKKAGVKLALVSKENELDLKEIKEKNKALFDNSFNVKLVDTIDDIIKESFLI